MLINNGLIHKDKHDKITNTANGKSADNSSLKPKDSKIPPFSKISGKMETQPGKSVLIEANRGFVNALVPLNKIRWWMGKFVLIIENQSD